MKVIVINYSGNVGKSVVSQHLLKPRLNNCEILAVESINFDGSQDEKLKGKEFSEILNKVMATDNIIVDVGASNVEEFLKQMKKSIGSHDDFDYYIIPTINRHKQIIDTVSTISALENLGVEKNKIRLLFNMLDEDTVINRAFNSIIDLDDFATININATIFENELFNRLDEIDNFISIKSFIENKTDYKALIMATDNKDERLTYSKQLGLHRLALGVDNMLDNTFNELFKDK
jgi:hypothetical protein